MEKFGEMIENLRKLREFVSLSELYDELMNKSGYIRALQLKGGAEEESRIEHIEELKSYIVDYEDKTERRRSAIFSRTWRCTRMPTSPARTMTRLS